MKKDNLIRYSMQLAFLKQLLEKKLISDREYSLIKNRLMKDYKIVSVYYLELWLFLCYNNTMIGTQKGGPP